MFGRYAGGIRAFLQQPLGPDECRRIVLDQKARREQSFLAILERGVYENPRSPYRRLLEHAGVRFPDAEALVARLGLEGALDALYDRGVYVTIDEFKGRKPIVRDGLTIETRAGDFDNPLLVAHYETRTGGSRGPRTRIVVDLDMLAYEAAQTQIFLSAFGIEDRPVGIWREVLPGPVGIKTFLRHTKIGGRVLAWFTPRKPMARLEDVKYQIFTLATAFISRLAGKAMPMPVYVPPDKAGRIAAWLAEQKQQRESGNSRHEHEHRGARVSRREGPRPGHLRLVLPRQRRAIHNSEGRDYPRARLPNRQPLLVCRGRLHRDGLRES